MSQLAGTLLGIVVAVVGGLIVYGGIKAVSGIRLDEEAEFNGTDLSTHRIHSEPERAPGGRQS
jgi:Amt family ammonium transporter